MDKRVITRGLAALSEVDTDIAAAVKKYGVPESRLRKPGLATFVSTIVSQQISTHAARSINERVVALLPEMSAQALMKVSDDDLRSAGLSRQKVSYIKALASEVYRGEFEIDRLGEMTDDDAIYAITANRGLGRWSAEIYLMFSLRRRDIFPADDLALQSALSKLKGLNIKPTPGECRKLIEHWAPWRSVGALFLWHYYNSAAQ